MSGGIGGYVTNISTDIGDLDNLFLPHIEKSPTALFDTLSISRLTYSSGRVLSFTAEDRAAVWNKLLEGNPKLSVNERDSRGQSLLHNIVLSASMDETEKVTLVEALADMGADFNIQDKNGTPPIDVALRLKTVETEVVEELRSHNAKLGDERRIPIIAHLLGAGGSLDIKNQSGHGWNDAES